MTKVNCYNYRNMCHFAQNCFELKKEKPYPNSFNVYVCSHVFIAYIIFGWIELKIEFDI